MRATYLPLYFALLSALFFSCQEKGTDPPVIDEETAIKVENAFPALTFTSPVDIKQAPGDSTRFFVVEQSGVIKVFQNNKTVSSSSTFLDITSKVVSGGERGLLGLAFHPQFSTNGFFYVNYTTGSPLRTVITRFKATGNQADAATEITLLRFNQPYDNHNGGALQFGKDGYLYIATGDGGSGGDPQNYAQNMRSYLGKILRVDVNGTEWGNYSVPADNPFLSASANAHPEIYAYGLRNPWRISFDTESGRLFAGDVGQNKREEIDIITKGGNYGWRLKEGVDCYNPASNCNGEGQIDPIHDYTQDAGDRSITGGYVYRGTAIPALAGKYIYGDFASGRIWALELEGDKKKSNNVLLEDQGTISSFGQDTRGEVYFLNYGQGSVMKLVNGN